MLLELKDTRLVLKISLCFGEVLKLDTKNVDEESVRAITKAIIGVIIGAVIGAVIRAIIEAVIRDIVGAIVEASLRIS
ncbi:hypothetical protein F8M41_021066 [Gigaspora margarita]|uniref:Uncharacterized protein n=1 Tax=Gigaspora margarita TaxID=4874 RepID=A0A8H4EJB5_GIGMA|nr:hypothetical protein F8M41_021066 [Gigaspora margarita]